jgi:hypothetical protein
MPVPSTPDDGSGRAPFPTPAWWVSDREGRVVLAQPPNPAIAVWLATVVIGWTGMLGDRREATLAHVGQGALLVWGLDELVRGASPARRLLGAVVLAATLARAFG